MAGDKHIDPLHEQIDKNEFVVINEDVQMHLVWTRERVFVKLIPQCLVSHEFWSSHLVGNHSIKALGFVRSCVLLIRHPSDVSIAKDAASYLALTLGKTGPCSCTISGTSKTMKLLSGISMVESVFRVSIGR